MRYNQFETLADDIDAVTDNLDDHCGSLDSMDLSEYELRAIKRLMQSMPYLLEQLTEAQ